MGRSVSPPGGNGRTPELPTPRVKAEYLSLIDIFRELPTDEITRLAVDLPMRTYSPGAVIYAPGEQSDVLFLLKRGTPPPCTTCSGSRSSSSADEASTSST